MTVYNWLCLIGAPTILATIFGFIVAKLKQNKKEIDAVKKGIQALLRDRLIDLYAACSRAGCASMDERENFSNMYDQYHSLGKNGVMDDIKKKFLELPVI